MFNIKLTIWKNFCKTEKKTKNGEFKKKKRPPRCKCVFIWVRVGACGPPARRRELGCRLLAWRCPSHFGESPRRIRGHRYNSCGGTLTPGDSSRSETCPPLPGSSDPSQDALVTVEKDEEKRRAEQSWLNTIVLFTSFFLEINVFLPKFIFFKMTHIFISITYGRSGACTNIYIRALRMIWNLILNFWGKINK